MPARRIRSTEIMKIIALEEHFITPAEMAELPPGAGRGSDREKLLGIDIPAALLDLGAVRLAAMDAGGIDVQVLSHNQPGCQSREAAASIAMAREANDILFDAVKAHPQRFAGLAAVPTPDPRRRGRRTRTRHHHASLQRRNDQRPYPGQFPGRPEILGDFRVRSCPAGADLPAPAPAASGGDESVFRGL